MNTSTTPNTDILNEMNALQASLRATKAVSRNITSDFFTATMRATALKIARMAQTDKEKASDYFDMQAKEMDAEEREIFANAFLDAVIEMGG